ncbi:hypothetical protein KA013_05090 [Patescibacteria group bacterium]|nr:hypothetical protein [Patescibacteria group bacterium]
MLDRFIGLFLQIKSSGKSKTLESKRSVLKDKTLEEQVKYIISIEDEKYNDNLLTPELRRYILALEKEYVTTLKDYKMHLAPSYREVK